ncbi:MAG: hypothetical protein O3A46_02390 [Candidatus Poribacteria bacterium]|nr:hypothetical protein [Candidatus Poribacteria bacterium]
MATWAFILSVIALTLAAGRWAMDWWAGTPPWRERRGRHERVSLRVELLAEGTNSFVIRGGYSLVFLSLRVYNRSEQRSATMARARVELRIGRHWSRTRRARRTSSAASSATRCPSTSRPAARTIFTKSTNCPT